MNSTRHSVECFRPLSGSYISQWNCTLTTVTYISRFRPLSGSYISQFFPWILQNSFRKGFRPLSGSYISQSYRTAMVRSFIHRFRPLSGSYISQYFISCVCLLFIFVSVPYRGATFLNCNNKKAWSWHAGERFPSPIGELHFSIVPCLQFSTDICFRPLSGSYISQ